MAQPETRSELNALRNIASAVSSNLDLDSLLNSIVSSVAANTEWDLCWITALDAANGTAEVIAREDKLTWSDASRLRVWPIAEIPIRDALHSLEPIIIDDAQNSEYRLYAEDARERGYRSGALLPLREMHPHGAPLQLSVQSRAPGPISGEAVEFLETVADLASIALVNARKVAEDRRNIARLTNSVSATSKLVDAVQRGDSLEELLESVADSYDASIILSDDSGAVVHVCAPASAAIARAESVAVHPTRHDHDAGHPAPSAEIGLQDHAGETYGTVTARSFTLGQWPRHAIRVHVVRDSNEHGVERALDLLASVGAQLAVSRSLMLAHDLEELSDEIIAELVACEDEPVVLRVRLTKLGVSTAGGERLVKILPAAGQDASRLIDSLPLLEPRWRSEHSGLVSGGWVGDGLALIARPAATTDDVKARVTALLDSARIDRDAVAVLISSPGVLPRDGKRMWDECGQLASLFGAGGATAYEEYGTLGFLLGAGADGRAATFIDDTIGPLLEYDEASGSDLVHTVEVLLSSTGKLQAVARELHIHVSTLRYRLDRAAGLLGMDLEDPDARFALLLACRLRRLFGER
ncbi:hypothetical protein ER308_13950 [Egibacter rhizosphaerae]|uniref:GAF domain-containing protein n=1 Tax=Egibacter rhizosphaerae TaxID=1670831 RepID=A0A411YGV9_9ACTN|nr:GAF domain-containing protein [Egibacter rhizosphaerae]QBI20555.1 hypothetical protein ER308_13950 [Egibacter rhizosphaerae]